MVTAIILSAGESLRFGSPKALADINGQHAIAYIQENLLKASVIDEIIIVLGAHVDVIKPYVFNHKKVKLVYNKNYKFGQTSSFQTGLSSVDDKTKSILMLPVDCPFVAPSTYQILIEHFNQHNPSILVPTYRHQRGHPPVFSSSLKNEILSLLPDKEGINTLFKKFPPTLLEVADENILKTFNTPEELRQLL